MLLVPFDEVVARVAEGRNIPGDEGEAASPHPELGVFLILDHAGHTLSSGAIVLGGAGVQYGSRARTR